MRITIKKKLIAGFATMVLLFAGFGIIVLSSTSNVQDNFRFVIEHDATVIANANQLLKLLVDLETGQRGFCITQKEEFLEPYIKSHDQFHGLLDAEKELVSDNPSQVKALERIEKLHKQWIEKAAKPEIAASREINKNHKSLKDVASLLKAGTGKALLDKIRAEFAKFIETEKELTAQRYANASQTTLKTRNITLWLVLFSVIVSFTIAVLSIRAIISPVRKLLKGTKIIGDGDFKHRIEINSRDEIGELAISFNQMVGKREQAECQLQAANQQLQAHEQQLKAANQQLDASNQHLLAKEQQLLSLNYNLNERVKELNGLYGLSKVIETPNITLPEIFQSLAELLPPSWRYPEITCGRVIFDDNEFKTDNFKETQWLQSADIKVCGEKQGTIEVYYLSECSVLDEGPFFKGERDLINALAERLSRVIERKQAEEEKREIIAEMERMNRLMTGREMRVIEMKKEVNALLAELGKEPEYKSVLEETDNKVTSPGNVL